MYCLLQDLNVDFRIRCHLRWSTAEYEALFLEQMVKRDAEFSFIQHLLLQAVEDRAAEFSHFFQVKTNSSFPWSCSTAHNINMQMSSRVISTENTAALRPVRAGLPACRAELTSRSLLTFLCKTWESRGKIFCSPGQMRPNLRNNTILQMMMMKKRQFLPINGSQRGFPLNLIPVLPVIRHLNVCCSINCKSLYSHLLISRLHPPSVSVLH